MLVIESDKGGIRYGFYFSGIYNLVRKIDINCLWKVVWMWCLCYLVVIYIVCFLNRYVNKSRELDIR